MSYSLLDSGNGLKLEQFGDFVIVRPCAQALWQPRLKEEVWESADAHFSRDGGNRWMLKRRLPTSWKVELKGLLFKISPTDFGHLGIFPEHHLLWEWAAKQIQKEKTPPQILNLFAYSGGATLAFAKAGAHVCHLDASEKMVKWARENARLNELEEAPIRWIVDDALKFLKRELKRGKKYEGIILDPPSFGRGNRGEVFKIERDLFEILNCCRQLLSEKPLFLVLSSHTPGMTPVVMHNLMQQTMNGASGQIESGEMELATKQFYNLPCGSFARWSC
ncbi:MAG TPA: class I SAM-dependent methyltransferase [Rhabdochlamydiaceae bacterium]|nr:class I SAM-dependent methyltransferase [Rhabdochlamydiaceae bacterium]